MKAGTTVKHYRIIEPLGAGGMGEVYRAEDVRLGRTVALKFLSPALKADAESRERLVTEARAASLLSSPHVAVTYDIGEHDGSIFIVMEQVEGELLSRRLERGPLSVREAMDVAGQVADALDDAHRRGIVHRDIKSANIIFTERGLAKVLDFGLAKFLESSGPAEVDAATRARVTAAGAVLGTVSYMAPEQALGQPVDARADLFSLGIVLFEMLTGRLPFEGATATEVIDRILHQPAPTLARFGSGIPPGLEMIVHKALEKEPGFRYQTARELYLDLQQLRQALGGASGTLHGPRTSWYGGGALAESLAPPPIESAVAVMTFANITREPADDWIGSGIAETVTADLKNVPELSVIGRARVFEAVKNLGSTAVGRLDDHLAIDLGRRLGATWIVGGGYQRQGDRLRITAQFVDVRTGAIVKTVKVDGHIGQIFDLQDRIVYELSQGLNLTLGFEARAEIERAETQSVDAYESYSRGMMNLRLATRDAIERAISLFERATEQDPNYAAAWAALGLAYGTKGTFLSIPELVHKAVTFERRALQLNPKLASAHLWLGSSFLSIGHHDEAIDAINEAIRLEPQNASAHAWLARAYWVGKGRIDDGIRELEHTVAMNPESGYAYLQLGLLYAWRGRLADAERATRRAIELQEQAISGNEGMQIVGAHTRMGYIHYLAGRYEQAIEEYERELVFLSSSDHALRDRSMIELRQKMGAAYLRLGQRDDAEREFGLAQKAFDHRVAEGADDPSTRYYVAALSALRGEAERALDHLERSSVHLRALTAVRAKLDPDFEGLRRHPRFEALVA